MALSAQTPTPRTATLEDFLAIPKAERFHEILDGGLVRKAMPSGLHGVVQRRLGGLLGSYDEGNSGPGGQSGGWWIMSEVEIQLEGRSQLVRPDIAGWRIDRMPEVPDTFPLTLRPDWVCEVVSPSDPARDTVIKFRDYARAGIPHYWMVDLAAQLVTCLRLSGEHYLVDVEASQSERFCAEPFLNAEISVAQLFRHRSQR